MSEIENHTLLIVKETLDDESPLASMEEKTSSMPSSPSTAPAEESHKRKLQELGLNSIPAPEPVEGLDMEDQSESKRPRFDINGDGSTESHHSVPQNGHQEEEKVEDEHPEEKQQEKEHVDNEPKVEDSRQQQQPEHADDTIDQSTKDQEFAVISTEEPASTEDREPEIKIADEQEPKPEAQEELPREGDIPVPSADEDTPLETQMLSRKIEVPNDKVGVLIGKSGDTIRSLQDNSGARIQIMRDAEADRQAATRPVELVGTLESLNRAEKLIKDVIAEADAGGSPSLVARGFSTVQAANGGEQLEMPVPMDKVGLIIGKGGETIRNLQTRSGARIQLIQPNVAEGEQSRDRIVRVTGSKKQIEVAVDMIKDVMNQTARSSSLSGGYHQQGFRPRGPGGPQWGPRGPHHAPSSGYDYPPRGGSYGSQGSQYPHPTYGNYPPQQQAPRSRYGPSWEQRPPASMHGPSPQGNYNYGRHQAPDSGHPPPYSQMPGHTYGHGYNESKYDNPAPSQHYGPMGSQPTSYAQGYGQQDHYNKPPAYPMQPQMPHSQPYAQPRPSQPEVAGPYQGTVTASQPYGQTAPPQQPYPYASSAPMPQHYAPYGSASTTDAYGHTSSAPPASAYPTSVPPATGYGQGGVQPYPQAAATGGYGSYPTAQPGYADQSSVANNATYGYQGTADPAYANAQGSATAAAYSGQAGYAQPTQAQPTYDQSGVYAGAPAPAAYPQYDSSQT